MGLQDLFKRKTHEEKMEAMRRDLEKLRVESELEELKTEIDELKSRRKRKGGGMLSGWNPDVKHLNFMEVQR